MRGNEGFGLDAVQEVLGNRIVANTFGVRCFGCQVERNYIVSHPGLGVRIGSSAEAEVVENVIVDTLWGIEYRLPSKLERNSLIGNRAADIRVSQPDMVASELTDNLVTGNGGGDTGGIEFLTAPPSATWSGNNIFDGDTDYEVWWQADQDQDAGGNWWQLREDWLHERIYDGLDTADAGIFNFSPVLPAPSLSAPVSPPRYVLKTASGADTSLSWPANPESDVTGYIVHWGVVDELTYANSVDVGLVTSYTLAGVDVSEDIAVTAYDADADGVEDQLDGHRSWYGVASTEDPREPEVFYSDEAPIFEAELNGPDPASQSFSMLNRVISPVAINYEVSILGDWLSVTPSSGTLNPGESVDLTIDVDNSSLPIGVHQAHFYIENPEGLVPGSGWETVTLTIHPEGHLFADGFESGTTGAWSQSEP